MISAQQAKELYVQPPYSEEDIESQIRQRAAKQSYTCFAKNRISGELVDSLIQNGYIVKDQGDAFLVSWD